jgi:hypothetical protein
MLRDGTRLAGRVLDLQGIATLGISLIARSAAFSMADKGATIQPQAFWYPSYTIHVHFFCQKHRPGKKDALGSFHSTDQT